MFEYSCIHMTHTYMCKHKYVKYLYFCRVHSEDVNKLMKHIKQVM